MAEDRNPVIDTMILPTHFRMNNIKESVYRRQSRVAYQEHIENYRLVDEITVHAITYIVPSFIFVTNYLHFCQIYMYNKE